MDPMCLTWICDCTFNINKQIGGFSFRYLSQSPSPGPGEWGRVTPLPQWAILLAFQSCDFNCRTLTLFRNSTHLANIVPYVYSSCLVDRLTFPLRWCKNQGNIEPFVWYLQLAVIGYWMTCHWVGTRRNHWIPFCHQDKMLQRKRTISLFALFFLLSFL